VRKRVAPDCLGSPTTAAASFDVVVGRHAVRVHAFATLRRLRHHSRIVEGRYEPTLYGSTWGVSRLVRGRRTGVCAVVTVAVDDPRLMETIAHEAVHAALRVLARRRVPHVSTTWQGGRAREEALATLAGQVAAAINRELHHRGLLRSAER
jgi:hypothetical protein